MQLGFLEFEVRDIGAWTTFFTEVLGAISVGDERFRIDSYAWRFQLIEGPADDLATVGWELEEAELDQALVRLEASGHSVTSAPAAERGARRRYTLRDPAGVPVELVQGLERASKPFSSALVPSGFVGDEEGLGHVVLTAPDKAASQRFYEELLGFKLSDHIVCQIYGHPVDLSFFHANPRHHSLAFGGPQPKRLHHFMLEAKGVDEVGRCYDRTIRSGAPIMMTLGRHPNDRMLSFYALTPSKFQFEFGWGARKIDDSTWQSTTYNQISEWGHHPPQLVFAKKRRP
jgi:2,3-dihydroxybiphenyl 1,2-dioxygenase